MRRIWYYILRRFTNTVKVRSSYFIANKKKFFTVENVRHCGFRIRLEEPKAHYIIVGKNLKTALSNCFPGKESRIAQIEGKLQTVNGLSLIKADLNRSARYLKAVKFKPKNEITEGLLVAAIIAYMKAFTNTTGRIQLQKQIIPTDLMTYHEQIAEVRNQYLSHADLAASFELSDNFLIVDENQYIIMNPILKTIRIFEARRMLPPLVKFLQSHVDERIERTRKEAEAMLNKLLPRNNAH